MKPMISFSKLTYSVNCICTVACNRHILLSIQGREPEPKEQEELYRKEPYREPYQYKRDHEETLPYRQYKPNLQQVSAYALYCTHVQYRVFIRYCVFYEFLKIFRTLFSLCVSVYTHTRQVEHQRCNRADRVQKNHNILRKKHNI